MSTVGEALSDGVVAVVGSTGTGKSAFSLDLAERLRDAGRPAEIVNADAMQLYRGMDIGTAKLPEGERRGVPHHLFDELEVTAEASVEWYQSRARAVIDDVLARGAVPLLVGGSGLYVSSVLFDFRFPGTDVAVRQRFERVAESGGPGALHELLTQTDPVAAERIGPHNARRLVRALEVGEITGEPFSAALPDEARRWRPSSIVGIAEERPVLVERLDARVRRMWADGLLDEVRGLLPLGLADGITASRAIGYAQAAAQLRGDTDEEAAIAETQALTRRYARRQVSWFTRYPDVDWSTTGDPAAVERALARLVA
ncbi:tRNA (adenosine(37)-N6)-dimethylallyltransferase MiaA [Frigoribacterium sp. VKM Ac-2530]|uniref:tRNA (adenosine(37)-N6)-dimethylallyltransferase MiaA n=1 Tax=Frigoribacterium sp. VKM Ac-2530 TaxID=2783822 RepID=UPI00188AB82C|nr:tRNA (adenosine(37)-N6)-dimethylallyltransferase MiaA [Frigoribacterium sp. VKM Ac-2530]MBF4579703.1 tRNA (adenosine(37)-N6)-dimethylallyltransferase MiaA [Frigoribacterium sp. VKM Ac-2530]